MHFRCLDKPGGSLQYSPQKLARFFVACCVLHNIAICNGCLLEINEDVIENMTRRDIELHVPMPIELNAPAAARVRGWQKSCTPCNMISK